MKDKVLHYYPLEGKKQVKKFTNYVDVAMFCCDKICEPKNKVFLYYIELTNTIMIGERWNQLDTIINLKIGKNFELHEHSSYEDAYENALFILNDNPLAY